MMARTQKHPLMLRRKPKATEKGILLAWKSSFSHVIERHPVAIMKIKFCHLGGEGSLKPTREASPALCLRYSWDSVNRRQGYG